MAYFVNETIERITVGFLGSTIGLDLNEAVEVTGTRGLAFLRALPAGQLEEYASLPGTATLIYSFPENNAANIGTPAPGVGANEAGDSARHVTTLTLNTTLPAIAGGAALALGKKIYTLPAGVEAVHVTHMSVAIKETEGNITNDTPDVGVGNALAVGAVATLDLAGAGAESILTGQTAADCDGTPTVKALPPPGGSPLVIESGDGHDIYLNVAEDAWAASGDAGALLTGTVVLDWSFLA